MILFLISVILILLLIFLYDVDFFDASDNWADVFLTVWLIVDVVLAMMLGAFSETDLMEEVVDSRMDFVLDKLAANNRLDVTVDIDGKLLLLSLLFDDVDDVDDDSSCALVWNMLQFSNCKLRKPKGRLVGCWFVVYS